MSENKPTTEPITIAYHPDLIVWRFIRDLVEAARETGKEMGMIKHLVGAILQLSFPGATIDGPTRQVEGKTVPLGDYLLGDTVFHVILSPVMDVYERCRDSIEQGFQVFLLVPDKYFCGTRQNAEIILPGKIMVNSIESFVCQNIERLAGYSNHKKGEVIRELLEIYNQRIKTLEKDLSLLIVVTGNPGG